MKTEKPIMPKKPYNTPRLVVYGDLRKLTEGGGGGSFDPSTGRTTRA